MSTTSPRVGKAGLLPQQATKCRDKVRSAPGPGGSSIAVGRSGSSELRGAAAGRCGHARRGGRVMDGRANRSVDEMTARAAVIAISILLSGCGGSAATSGPERTRSSAGNPHPGTAAVPVGAAGSSRCAAPGVALRLGRHARRDGQRIRLLVRAGVVGAMLGGVSVEWGDGRGSGLAIDSVRPGLQTFVLTHDYRRPGSYLISVVAETGSGHGCKIVRSTPARLRIAIPLG